MANELELLVYDHTKHSQWLSGFSDVLIDCLDSEERTVATFAHPWDKKAITKYWTTKGLDTTVDPSGARDGEVQTGMRFIVFVLARTPEGEQEVGGYAMLCSDFSQTGGFRGEIQKLMVSPRHRKKRIASMVMNKLESIALENKTTLLMLDTQQGSPAELIYPKLGYTKMGVIPDFEISSKSGEFIVGVFFYKILPQHTQIWGPK